MFPSQSRIATRLSIVQGGRLMQGEGARWIHKLVVLTANTKIWLNTLTSLERKTERKKKQSEEMSWWVENKLITVNLAAATVIKKKKKIWPEILLLRQNTDTFYVVFLSICKVWRVSLLMQLIYIQDTLFEKCIFFPKNFLSLSESLKRCDRSVAKASTH